MRSKRSTGFGAALLFALGCASESAREDAAADGAVPRDASPGLDASATRDADSPRDADVLPSGRDSGEPVVGPEEGPADASAPARYFPEGAVWYEDVTRAAVDRESDDVIAWLEGEGFGLGRLQIDFSIEVLEADESAPLRQFTPTDDFFRPDCDEVEVPLPAGGALEAEPGYACADDGDCHLIVVDRPTNRLFEMWRANVTDSGFFGGCLAVWDMTRVYGPSGRGEQCTSADAAGFPIAPLLFTTEEVARGEISHAIRFILPNPRIREGEYVHPATHGTPTTSGPAGAPPYGARLRLRPDYPLEQLPNEGARTVARAMQRFGMILADAGNVALTGKSDRFDAVKWDGLLAPRDLDAIRPRDFQMIEAGARIPLTLDCVREP